jgi:hypothetical protein
MTKAPETTNSARTLWLSPKKWGNDDIHSYSLNLSARSVPLGPIRRRLFQLRESTRKGLLSQGLQLSCGGVALPARDEGACASGRDLGMNSKKLGSLFQVQNCTILHNSPVKSFGEPGAVTNLLERFYRLFQRVPSKRPLLRFASRAHSAFCCSNEGMSSPRRRRCYPRLD